MNFSSAVHAFDGLGRSCFASSAPVPSCGSFCGVHGVPWLVHDRVVVAAELDVVERANSMWWQLEAATVF
jgi:hypothetical protein